jgi:hypothetical protein
MVIIALLHCLFPDVLVSKFDLLTTQAFGAEMEMQMYYGEDEGDDEER